MPAEPAPAWLAVAFPGHAWQGLQRCQLRVKEEEGAGLDLEACEYGYLVDDVSADVPQDPALKKGVVVVEIGGIPLIGLHEDDLSDAFGKRFKEGASLLVAPEEELRSSATQQDDTWQVSQVVLTGEGANGGQEAVKRDLPTFVTRAGVRAELYSDADNQVLSVIVAGPRGKVGAARPELGALLSYYGYRGGLGVGQKRGAETLEVGGMVVQSLPARNRRRRIAPDVVEEEEEAAKEGADGEEGEKKKEGGDGEASSGVADVQKCGKELHQYEYMDHTADVIIHSWGTSLEEAIGQVCVCYFSYMTDIEKLEKATSFEVEATGHDMLDMLYHLLDEFLFHFGTNFIMCRHVDVIFFDQENLKIRARGYGERFDLSKHTQGTEIKAITMHQMKILTPTTLITEEGTIERTSDLMEGGTVREGFPYECYVLVDI